MQIRKIKVLFPYRVFTNECLKMSGANKTIIMVEIDHNRFVYYRKSNQAHYFDAIKARLMKLGIDKKRILNEETTIHTQVGDYIAFVNDIRQPPKLLLDEVLDTRDNNPNVMIHHGLPTKTVWEGYLFDC